MKELEGHELTEVLNLLEDALQAHDIKEVLKYVFIVHDNNQEVLKHYRDRLDEVGVLRYLYTWLEFEHGLVAQAASVFLNGNKKEESK